MIVVVKGVLGGADLSGYVDRLQEFSVEAAMGARIDTLAMTLFDPNLALAIPDRAEVIIYDASPGALLIDPPGSNTAPLMYAYDNAYTYDGAAKYDTQPPLATNQDPKTWTPRLFGGYISAVDYEALGPQRQLHITAQDYTFRTKTTVVNQAYGPDQLHPSGWSDKQIVQDLFLRYLPDIDIIQVRQIVAHMPTINLPTHTVEQVLQRVTKISTGYYRVDYYKRLFYGLMGSQSAPFAVSDVPNALATPPSFAAERVRYTRDASNAIDRIWIVGASYTGPSEQYTLAPPSTGQYVWPLPAKLAAARTVSVSINGVDQGTAGVLGVDGTLDAPAAWSLNFLIGKTPPVIGFKTPPPANAVIVVTGAFIYPLIRVNTDAAKVAALGGIVWDRVLRDRRIDNIPLADQVATAHLALEGTGKANGSMLLKTRSYGGALLQPGQVMPITSAAAFTNVLAGGSTTLNALLTKVELRLTDDTSQPYDVTVSFSDRPDLNDDDLFGQIGGMDARVNAALEQTDVVDIATGALTVAIDHAAFAPDTGTTATQVSSAPTYNGAATWWGFFRWA